MLSQAPVVLSHQWSSYIEIRACGASDIQSMSDRVAKELRKPQSSKRYATLRNVSTLQSPILLHQRTHPGSFPLCGSTVACKIRSEFNLSPRAKRYSMIYYVESSALEPAVRFYSAVVLHSLRRRDLAAFTIPSTVFRPRL